MEIRRGVTRTVFLTRRYAIKVPALRRWLIGGALAGFCRGVLSNLSELEWHDADDFRGRVAPVLHSWLSGMIQVYPRCAPVPADWNGPYPETSPRIGDEKPANVGILDGRIVWVDYPVGGIG